MNVDMYLVNRGPSKAYLRVHSEGGDWYSETRFEENVLQDATHLLKLLRQLGHKVATGKRLGQYSIN